jgi:hypothetical protein
MAAPELTPLPLMQLATGFWASKALFAAHELGLFSLLSRRDGSTAAQVAADLDIAERPAEMLLTACASLGLLDKRDGRYRNSPLAAKYLVPGGPDYCGGFIAFNDKRIYRTYGQLTDAVRTNRPAGWDPATQRSFYDTADTTITRDFYEVMHSLSPHRAGARLGARHPGAPAPGCWTSVAAPGPSPSNCAAPAPP